MTPRIVGVGNAHVDYTYTVSSLPEADAGGVIHDRSRRLGGTELNVLRILETLGHEPGLIARLGADDVGAFVRDHLAETAIDTTRLRTVPEDASSYCLVVQTPDGRRAIFGGGESSFALSLSGADDAYLEDADVVFTSGFTPVRVLERLVDRPPLVVFDLAGTMEELRPRGYTRERLTELVPATDIVVGTEIAFESWLETTPTPAALRAYDIDRGAITAGPAGARIVDRDAVRTIPALDVTVADTTGAGDAFTAGLIDRLLAGQSLIEAGGFAAAAAGLACTVSGPGVVPNREPIEQRAHDAGLYSPKDR